ncbi:protein phosphatase 1 regulatory subunit 3C-B [Aplochiton taeniatus]
MNCTRVLTMLNPRPMPGPIMPVDMAMRICLASSPPLRSFLSSYDDYRSNSSSSSGSSLLQRHRPLRPCLSSKTHIEPSSSPGGSTRTWQSPKPKKKKSVVFADSKGMSLTAIHVFKEFEEDPLAELQFDLSDLEGAAAGLRLTHDKGFVLDFPQPATDYLDFRNRLKRNQVCLENCSVQEHCLSGTIKVANISFEKSVSVRATIDGWQSHKDVECTFLNNVYGCPETDTFSFSLDLPTSLSPGLRVEFCLQYQALGQTYWDNNDGNNYRLVQSDSSEPSQSVAATSANAVGAIVAELRREVEELGKGREMEFDQFGSPRTSAGIFPEWQSWGRIENSAPYW